MDICSQSCAPVIFPLISATDNRLHSAAASWDFNNPPMDAQWLCNSLQATMLRYDGIGLASTQVGVMYRVFVMGMDAEFTACFNPRILDSHSQQVHREGCLSYPGLFLDIERAYSVNVEYQDAQGVTHVDHLKGFPAQCFQHELDHLNGTVFTDKVSKLTVNMAQRRRDKLNKRKIG